MKEYFNLNERNDYQLLTNFNNQTHIFDKMRPTKEGSHTDAVATHVNKLGENRTFNIELKRRHMDINTYPNIFIEDYKLASMMLDYQIFGVEPLYINFLDNNVVVIFNLSKLKVYPTLYIKNINSNGKDRTQLQERRYGLSMTDAVIYKDYKLKKGLCKTTRSS